MKKNVSLFFIVVLALLYNQVYAQPTLTASGSNPSVGDSFTNAVGDYVNPGNPGADQTWDLSSMFMTETFTLTYADPSTTPYGNDFPGANLAEISSPPFDQISYYNTSWAAFQFHGAVFNGLRLPYSDPEDLLRFPLTYNDSYVDNWEVQFVSEGDTYYRRGVTTATVDGYGTLITPDTTYNNVLRIHYVQDYQDSVEIHGAQHLITYHCDLHLWYTNGIPHKLARVHSLTSSVGYSESQGVYLSDYVVGRKENTEKLRWEIYPNPAVDKVTLEFPDRTGQNVEICLYNALGEKIETGIQPQKSKEYNRIQMDISALSEGFYLVRLIIDGEIAESKRLVKM